MVCDRCKNETDSFQMSFFNTDLCCPHCVEIEKKHPLYFLAKITEHAHAAAGDYGYQGIGLPSGYENWAKNK